MELVEIPGEDRPFKLYENRVLLSIGTYQGKGHDLEVDLLLRGEKMLLSQGLCALMERHDVLVEVVLMAAALYVQDNAEAADRIMNHI
jgi:hypothetical protein